MSKTTPTGIPIIDCEQCSHPHPVTRKHCKKCGRASAFINYEGLCLLCGNNGSGRRP